MTKDLSNGVVTKGELIDRNTTDSRSASAGAPRLLPKKSAEESLGLPPGTGLLMPFTVATVGMILLLIVLTVIPYVMDNGRTTAEIPVTPAANEKQEQSTTTQPAAPPTPVTPPTQDPSSKVNPKVTVKSDFPDKLGENASKTAKPNVNPLDKKDDDLLKEIK
jgi:hypothetical protein